jgi:hypothetical protein
MEGSAVAGARRNACVRRVRAVAEAEMAAALGEEAEWREEWRGAARGG